MRRMNTHTETSDRPVMPLAVWNEIYDAIDLARDALGDGPADVDHNFLLNNVMHLRIALRAAHRCMETSRNGGR